MSKNEKKTFKVLKSIAKNDEKNALKMAIQKTGLTSHNLKAKHTDKVFVFEQIR